MPQKEIIDTSPQKCPNSCKDPACKEKPWPLDTTKTPIIWVLGGPGSGKTTLCEMLVPKYECVHLSTGELLRVDLKKKTKRAKVILNCMRRGALVPNDIVMDLLYEAMLNTYQTARGFLIDGYPREKDQGVAFENTFAPCNLVLQLDAPIETLKARLVARIESGSKRPDDMTKVIGLQLKTFKENHEEVQSQYKDKIRAVDADKPIEEVFAEVVTILDPIFGIETEPEEELPTKPASTTQSLRLTSRNTSRSTSRHKTHHSSQPIL